MALFSTPKVLHLLRGSPLALQIFDGHLKSAISKNTNSTSSDIHWLQASLLITHGSLKVKRVSSLLDVRRFSAAQSSVAHFPQSCELMPISYYNVIRHAKSRDLSFVDRCPRQIKVIMSRRQYVSRCDRIDATQMCWFLRMKTSASTKQRSTKLILLVDSQGNRCCQEMSYI